MGDDTPSQPDDEWSAGKSFGQPGTPEQEDPLAHLTDTALRIKEAIEDRDAEGLGTVLAANAKVNIDGRFLTVPELVDAAKRLFRVVEQPTFDLLAIEGSEAAADTATVSYLTELSWIDQKVFEEHSIKGLLTLHYSRTKKGWATDGFTYARRPEVPRVEEGGVAPTPGVGGATFGGLAGLFGAKDGGDIWSMWY